MINLSKLIPQELAAAEGSALKPLDVKTIKANRQRIYQEKQLREVLHSFISFAVAYII